MTPTSTSTCPNNLLRGTSAEKSPGRRSPHTHSNPAKGRSSQLKNMKETPPSNGKVAPKLFYCHPTDDKGGCATRPTVMGVVLAFFNCSTSTKLKWSGGQASRAFLLHDNVRILRQASAL